MSGVRGQGLSSGGAVAKLRSGRSGRLMGSSESRPAPHLEQGGTLSTGRVLGLQLEQPRRRNGRSGFRAETLGLGFRV